MDILFNISFYNNLIYIMIGMAFVVFFALQYVTAGYGMMYTKKWGPTVNNKLGWVLMEAPVFFAMLALWIFSDRRGELAPSIIASVFLLHYFQRSFIFPFLIKGKSRMPIVIMLMGITFNLLNAYLIGGWLFYISPIGYYDTSWLWSPQFLIGVVIFGFGFYVNLQSDNIIRKLRKPGDTRHYIPRGGMYRYVCSANYFGELTEWIGFAILSWSVAGLVFVLWTFANLAPRARSLHKRYCSEFGDEFKSLHRKYILPFIY